MSSVEAVLAHHGVKGMKWGVRKDDSSGGGSAPTLSPDAALHVSQRRELGKQLIIAGLSSAAAISVGAVATPLAGAAAGSAVRIGASAVSARVERRRAIGRAATTSLLGSAAGLTVVAARSSGVESHSRTLTDDFKPSGPGPKVGQFGNLMPGDYTKSFGEKLAEGYGLAGN